MVEQDRTRSKHGAGAVLCGIVLTWIAPGLGHWYLVRRGKAVLYFTLLTFAYLFGMWLADWRNVNRVNFDLHIFGEVLYGGLTLPALFLTRHLALDREQPWLEAGLLFTTVAGILNACVMVDVYETVFPRPEPRPKTA